MKGEEGQEYVDVVEGKEHDYADVWSGRSKSMWWRGRRHDEGKEEQDGR